MRAGRLLGAGSTANVYEWGATEVVKIFHDRESSAGEAAKEARKARIVDQMQLRAPRFSGLYEYEGTACLVFERIDGPTVLRCIEPAPASVTFYATLMARLHVELHHVEAAPALDPDLTLELARIIRGAEPLAEAERATVLEVLGTLPEGRSICHYDFHPGNIIMSPRGPVIIDWMNAFVGNPAADVARTSMMIGLAELPPDAPLWLSDGAYRARFGEEYLAAYSRLSGMAPEDVSEWLAPSLAVRASEVRGAERRRALNRLRSVV